MSISNLPCGGLLVKKYQDGLIASNKGIFDSGHLGEVQRILTLSTNDLSPNVQRNVLANIQAIPPDTPFLTITKEGGVQKAAFDISITFRITPFNPWSER